VSPEGSGYLVGMASHHMSQVLQAPHLTSHLHTQQAVHPYPAAAIAVGVVPPSLFAPAAMLAAAWLPVPQCGPLLPRVEVGP
jgi:hypothetical protein